MTLTFNGKPIAAKPAPNVPEPEIHSPVLLFLRIVALNLDARRELADVVRRRRTLETKLADPALADHPKRPAAERRLAQREEEERLATTRLIELNVALEREWEALPADVKRRFALTDIIGEPDPQASILVRLWGDDCTLSRMEPFPADWTVPNEISHKALDTGIETRDYSAAEVMNAPCATF